MHFSGGRTGPIGLPVLTDLVLLFLCAMSKVAELFYSPWQVRHGLSIQIAAIYGPDPVLGYTTSSLESIQEW